jgi:hypothetical protein
MTTWEALTELNQLSRKARFIALSIPCRDGRWYINIYNAGRKLEGYGLDADYHQAVRQAYQEIVTTHTQRAAHGAT